MQFSIESIDKVCGSLLSRVSINDFPGDELFFQKPDWLQFIQDIQLAKHFVSERIPIFTDPQFVASSERGRCPEQYVKTNAAINAHIMANCIAGLGILITKDVATSVMSNYHLQLCLGSCQ